MPTSLPDATTRLCERGGWGVNSIVSVDVAIAEYAATDHSARLKETGVRSVDQNT